MNVTVFPSTAHGTVSAPPSKSMAHRLLLCAGLASGESRIENVANSRDVQATIASIRALGAHVALFGGTAVVNGCDPRMRTNTVTLPCSESGSTLRFCLPLCLLCDAPAILTGTETLLSRPLSVYKTLLEKRGVDMEAKRTSVAVQGRLSSGAFVLPGDVSSQFVSGLLFTLPLLNGDSTIELLPPIESRPYIDLTLSALRTFGVAAFRQGERTLFVPGGQTFSPQTVSVEGDWSNAAFLEGLNLLGGDVTVTGLDEASEQGDRVYRSCFQSLKAGTPTLSLADCPDLGPVLFALAAAQNGATFADVGRLRGKESDRIDAMRKELAKFGVRTEADERTLTVHAGLWPPTEPLDGHNDHRVVMALALLCTKTGGTICGAEAVCKSFPDFFAKLKELGVTIDELDQQQ